jgi:hypothetical protein
MPYQAGSRLPGEKASKLGHLSIVKSSFIKALVDQFEFPQEVHEDPCNTQWMEFDPTSAKPLSVIAAVDGSLQTVSSQDKLPIRELSFVKTALVRMDKQKIDAIDPKFPHPLQLKSLMAETALYHATLFPLKNIKIGGKSNYDVIREIIKDSMLQELDGEIFQTLKWLAYQKWSSSNKNSPSFHCPHCNQEVQGLPFDADKGTCEHCRNEMYLTDMIGFHLEMNEDFAPESIASSYMLVHETLLIFTFIKYFWDRGWYKDLTNVLLIKDGPLTLRSQYSKLVPAIRAFLDFANSSGYPICLIGQEKSGVFFDHLKSISRFTTPKTRGEKPSYSVLSHRYVREHVYRTPDLKNPYGMRTNYGEKIFVKIDPYTQLVLSIPTGLYNPSEDFPSCPQQIIGLERILATLPSLISHRHEGALVPVELANGVASLSSYPSAQVLKIFARII